MLLKKENLYVIKGSAGMKKRMKYDGTDKYNGFLACLSIFFYDYIYDVVLLQEFFVNFSIALHSIDELHAIAT
jgi:hypothetical protein